jgi:dTDP-4-dehydrorhamnose reductase
LGDNHLIVRTSWLYGQQGPNFVLTMLRLARERPVIRVVSDQTGSPTWTGHLAPAIVRLLERDARGTFHISNGGATSWHGFAVAIMSTAGIDVRVEAVSSAEYPAAAARPLYSLLDNRRWRELGEPPLPMWEVGLRKYLDSLRA